MVRSMYSGVAGMRANQNRLDVIGNNIANSNTYGFKSGRVTFRDIYYQQYKGASEGTQTRGGINPSSIGYGSQLASIDLMMDSASMTSTGFALDCAITGDGFFQVMDPDGNIYYTKAGMLDIDQATGALLDTNGNFVLGTSATEGKIDSTKPGQNKIIIALDAVPASTAKIVTEIGGRALTIESTNQTKDANVSFTFTKSSEMPDGQKVRIVREGTSSVYNVQLNANEYFDDMDKLGELINQAITENYGGTHPAGDFHFSIEPNPFVAEDGTTKVRLTGAQLVDTPIVEYEGGSVTLESKPNVEGFSSDDESLGLKFSGKGDATLKLDWISKDPWTGGLKDVTEPHFVVTMTVGSTVYQGAILLSRLNDNSAGGYVLLRNQDPKADPSDTITIKYPSRGTLLEPTDATNPTNWEDAESLTYNKNLSAAITGKDTTANPNGVKFASVEPNEPTKKCGWGKATFTLEGGTEFHTQTVSDITGISVGADGTITGTTENGLQVLGRIDLANFGNPRGLAQVGNSYFAETVNSGHAKLSIPGENGTGAIKNSALEMSNVDLAQEFSDMIVTQRSFQASSRMITVSDTMLEELTNLKR